MRVDKRELWQNEDTGQLFREDDPFTGTACLYYDSGRLASEGAVVDGRETGPTREWYESGAIKSECRLDDGSAEGPFREWHENGRLKREGVFDHSVFTEYRVWDEAGKLVEEYRMQEGDEFHRHLQFLKRAAPPPEQ